MGRRDGDRLTREELTAVQRHLDGVVTDSSDRTRLRRVRRREPPSPKDVARWAVQDARALEMGHRIWGSRAPGETVTVEVDGIVPIPFRRPPRALEESAQAFMDEIASRGSARFLRFLESQAELKRLAEENLPRLGYPPGVFEGEGAGDRLVLYSCLRGRNRGEEPARAVEEYLMRAQVEGYEERHALDTLHAFRDEEFLEWFSWPPPLETRLRLVEKPPARAGRIVFDTLHPTARRRLEGEAD